MNYDEACAEVISLEKGCQSLSHTGVWTQIGDTDDLPSFGFKIHVSAGLDSAGHVLLLVAKALDGGVTFKFARDMKTLASLNMGLLGVTQARKVITIYPQSRDHFLRLVEVLKKALRGESGPRPLSDSSVPESDCLYFRYGSLLGRSHRGRAGSNELDERSPGRTLPEGVEDPWGRRGSGEPEGAVAQTRLFAGRYLVLRALSM
ncbi:class III lanthionine synthetase LanKC N-terminal domain-containing protein [Cutibacterium porci]